MRWSTRPILQATIAKRRKGAIVVGFDPLETVTRRHGRKKLATSTSI